MAKRFTEAEKQAALADLKNGMTLEQAAKKHKCSTASLMQWKKPFGSSPKISGKRALNRTKAATASAIPSMHTERIMELEDENKYLKDENQSLRSLMLDGYIAREQHPRLRKIAEILREARSNQLQRIMEVILVVETEEPVSGDGLGHSDSAAGSTTNGLPRHPSGAIRLRRKAEQAG